MTPPRTSPPYAPSEAEFQGAVIDLARLLRWRVAHFRVARTAHGWRTPVAADGQGFPDLVMVRRERLLFVELKARKGRVTPAQEAWHAALHVVAGATLNVEVHVWRPDDWPAIEQTLR